MRGRMQVALVIVAVVLAIGWLGFQVPPRPFPDYPEESGHAATIAYLRTSPSRSSATTALSTVTACRSWTQM